MPSFQVKLGGDWKDYTKEEDKILKRAFMAGFPTAKFHLRGQNYIYDFKSMKQINKETRKERDIRPPFKWKAPSKPLVPPGKTTVINVPPGAPGTTIQVPYPGRKGEFIAVNVPPTAKVGQAMLVPVPDGPSSTPAAEPAAAAAEAPAAGGGGWSTGAKVAAGAAGVAVVGGLAVGGVVLGEHIAEHGVDATVDAAGDGLEAAGEAIGDFAVDAGEFVVDAAEDVGDFVMDLF
mmetsp:Transcript_115903/g.201207  ORF Transcript_115903/g.201207 Transcript_115903/m.201207 type:complete len:233 (+) Transcript_115903:92-790(+)